MYFDPEPKSRLEDFFNMEEELRAFMNFLKGEKLIVVTGLRRYGKTSLILTGLNASKLDYIFLDCRLLPSGMISMSSFLELVEEELNRRSWAKKLLRGIEEVSIGDFIRIRKKDGNTLLRIIESLEEKVIVLDEAQELRRSGYNFNGLLAYMYDHLNSRVVVSGSKIGLLYDFLRVNDPEAPLFGRPFAEVKLRRLSPEKSREFLERGFEQEGFKAKTEVIEKAVDKFDGIIGWLTYFGNSYARRGESLESVMEKACSLAASEVDHALNIYGAAKTKYLTALKIVASSDGSRWSEIKRAMEAKFGRIANNIFSNMMKNLVNQGLIEKENGIYRISDPVLKLGILRYIVK